jgi:signal transduction histidine kinase
MWITIFIVLGILVAIVLIIYLEMKKNRWSSACFFPNDKLRLEKTRLNSAIQAVCLGTSFLNHTIKNEILNISICVENIKSMAGESNRPVLENLQFICNSTDHMINMVSGIHEQMREIVIKKTPNRFIGIIEQALIKVLPLLESKTISVNKEYNADLNLLCDPIHIRKLFINLFTNAGEAMSPGGKLRIQVNQKNKWLIATIQDDGIGILKENLGKIFDPFYSTKNRRANLGLGLSYCYRVMQQHGGLINIQSNADQGTIVNLFFKITKIKIFT